MARGRERVRPRDHAPDGPVAGNPAGGGRFAATPSQQRREHHEAGGWSRSAARGADRYEGEGHGAILVSVGRRDIRTICSAVRPPATDLRAIRSVPSHKLANVRAVSAARGNDHFVGSSVACPPTHCQRPFRWTKISVMRRGPGTYPFAAPRTLCRPVRTATAPNTRTLRSASRESVHCTSLDIDSAISCEVQWTDSR